MQFPIEKRIIIILTIFWFLFLSADFSLAKECTTDADCPGYKEKTVRCLETREGKKECVRTLEIVYPKIGKEELTVEKVAKEGLPGYVKYIFTFSVGLIGLIIFGAIIYNGFLYFTSAGKPEQMTEARKGIIYAFFGGIILLSSVLIFNTINPQLKILELPKVPILEQVIIPGIYICNYTTTTVADVLDRYIKKTGEEQIKAAEQLQKIIWNPQTKQGCPMVNFSGNFQNFQVTKENTIFIVPSISIDPETKVRTPKYEYGFVLHEKDNWRGNCAYFPKGKSPYRQMDGYAASNLPFTVARSITLFQKPAVEPTGEGVFLYKNFNYNRDDPKATTADQNSFKPEGTDDVKEVSRSELGDRVDNTRSISFSPPGSYLALLYNENDPAEEGPAENNHHERIIPREAEEVLQEIEERKGKAKEEKGFKRECTVLHKNNPNLADVLPTSGECKTGFWAWIDITKWGKCKPQLKSMIVIKGIVI